MYSLTFEPTTLPLLKKQLTTLAMVGYKDKF